VASLNKRISCRTIIILDDKLICIYHNRYGDIYWTLPGGGLEENESIEYCAVREAKEELNISVRICGLPFIYEDKESLQFIFTAEYISGNLILPIGSIEVQRSNNENIYRIDRISFDELNNTLLKPQFIKAELLRYKSNVYYCSSTKIISNYPI